LKELFAEHGEVTDAKVIVDRMSGRSRGFGFVEMANSEEAAAAIEALNGNELEGRELKVNEAKPRDD
jgi:RNA recognition motif-containing protein